MSRYIDADSLKAEFTGNFACEYPAPLVKALIDNQPAVDAVKVVRCKDCIYFQDRYIELPDGSKRPYKKGENIVPPLITSLTLWRVQNEKRKFDTI